jgi:hypothetical protein
MFMRCLNPDCGAPFDYREGRLIRFSKPPLDDQLAIDQHRVEHYWLCGKCSNLYHFEYQPGAGMKIKLRVRETQETASRHLVAVA